jgi:hypothetical protein
MILLTPPPTVTVQADIQPFDLNAYNTTHIHPQSEPSLRAALSRLYQDVPSFRVLLARYATEHSNVMLNLQLTEERSFGSLVVDAIPNGYVISVVVQGKPARIGLDSLEPWLGSTLYGLFEISHEAKVLETLPNRYIFESSVLAHMWNYQDELRRALRKANSEPKLVLTGNGKLIYRTLVLRKRSDPKAVE